MKHFNKTTENMTQKQKFDYIKNHFQYYTLNIWDSDKSVANKIKINSLPLTKEQLEKAYEIVCDENFKSELWEILSEIIRDFDIKDNKSSVYASGKNNGYLVLENNCFRHILICDNFKYLIDDMEFAESDLNYAFDLLVEFDNLCDNLLDEFIYLLDNVDIEEKSYLKEIKYKSLSI